jgi:O-antigen ligase
MKFRSFLRTPHLLLLSLYFVLMSVTFLWSRNTHYFLERIQIMLPFLVLPFAFHCINNWKIKWYQNLFLFFIISVQLGIIWSLSLYFSDKEMYDTGYSYSRVIPTPFKGDHIRFSLAVVASICFSVFLALKTSKRWLKVVLICLAALSITYLHILSVKSGLLAFYMLAFVFIIRILLMNKYRKYAIVALSLLLFTPFVMYKLSASFRNKLSYIEYSIYEMRNGDLQSNISDEGRLISFRFAIEIIKQSPIIGVGLGDVEDEMDIRFKRDVPSFNGRALLPHNQFLMIGVAFGVFGIVYLVLLQLALIWHAKRNDFLYSIIWLMLIFAMMIEPLYETQYGTCLYLFLLLLTYKNGLQTNANQPLQL